MRILLLLFLTLSLVTPLVASDGPAAASDAANTTSPPPRTGGPPSMPEKATEPPLPDYPEAIASFGAAVAGDHVYIYGGHVGRTHQHSINNLSHAFRRLDLTDPATGWQSLGEAPGLQGLPLATDGKWVCRVGGLTAKNPVGEDEDLYSVDEVRCFDIATESWKDLPALPRGRSSHDAVYYDGKIWAVGGWELRGAGNEGVWHDTVAVLDLADLDAGWQDIEQPFERRALSIAALDGKLYAFGGISRSTTSDASHVYDIATGTWTEGPVLPAVSGLKGFGSSAFAVDDRILYSAGDGLVYSLHPDEGWLRRGKLDNPRFFHRLIRHDDKLLAIGGASFKGHHADVERLTLESLYDKAPGLPPARWASFRNGHGTTQAVLPTSWSDDDNVAWRASLPGVGQSAPVAWGDQAIVSSAAGDEKESLVLSSIDLASGEVHWRRRFESSRPEAPIELVSNGAPTPAIDYSAIYTLWESGDLIAVDHDGETLWKRSLNDDYGPIEGNHGIASSPVLTREAVLVQMTHGGPSYLAAFDKKSGETMWKVELPTGPAWSTPVPFGDHIALSVAGNVGAVDPKTGETVWHVEGVEGNRVPSMAVDGDLLVVPSKDAGHIMALRAGSTEPIWRAEGTTSGFGAPAIVGPCVLVVNRAGAVTCLDRETGESAWQHRLTDATWASPVVKEGHAYFFTKGGHTHILEPTLEGPGEVAVNHVTVATTVYGVAAVPSGLLLRTGSELIRVGDVPSLPIPADNAETQVASAE